MLRDRLELLEKDVLKYRTVCGELYLKIATAKNSEEEKIKYNEMNEKLLTMLSDIEIVKKLINSGHK
jgi:hypothetical protein